MTYRAFTGPRPRRAYPWHVLRVLAVGVPCLLAACTVPEHMEVRAGKDPRNQDDDVRFRTTYYFRVFDACRAGGEANGTIDERQIIPDTDSLYRYQMTGKAFSLFTNVHFEAGVLKSYEIDPFGANVVFDPDTNRFSFKSRQQTEKDAARKADYRELERLMGLYKDHKEAKVMPDEVLTQMTALIGLQLKKLGEGQATTTVTPVPYTPDQKSSSIVELEKQFRDLDDSITEETPDEEKARIEREKEHRLATLKYAIAQMEKAVAWRLTRARLEVGEEEAERQWTDIKVLIGGLKTDIKHVKIKPLITSMETRLFTLRNAIAQAAAAGGPLAIAETGTDSGECSKGQLRRRGFQILGPEGWRTFNQDERLLLAMSSSGKPLISTMKDLSARVLNEQSDRSASMLPLIQERLKISKTRRKMDALEPTLPPGGASASAFGDIVKSVRETFDEQP